MNTCGPQDITIENATETAEIAGRAQTEHCMMCGEPLGYHEQPLSANCPICGVVDSPPVLCPGGTFICDYFLSR